MDQNSLLKFITDVCIYKIIFHVLIVSYYNSLPA